MRITAIKHLERSLIGKPRLWLEFNRGESVADATQMYTFENGQTLFLMENLRISDSPMILADRDGIVSVSNGQPEFTLKPIECRDCIEAKKAAYSDATTPGFFRPYCPKHDPQRGGPASA